MLIAQNPGKTLLEFSRELGVPVDELNKLLPSVVYDYGVNMPADIYDSDSGSSFPKGLLRLLGAREDAIVRFAKSPEGFVRLYLVGSDGRSGQ
jgi:hypothetical protein